MKQFYFLQSLFLFCLLLLCSACDKDSPEPDEPYVGNGYIRGNFGSEYLNYTVLPNTTGGPTWGSSYEADINGGQLYLSRDGAHPDGLRSWSINISGIDLDNMPIPIEFSSSQPYRTNQGHPTGGGFGITDASIPSHITYNGPEDSYNYWGNTYEDGDVTIRITSKKDDVIKGTFEGRIKTQTGLVKEVTKGEFMIKISRVE